MRFIQHRRTVLHGVGALGLWGLLPRAQACEYFGSTLRITHPWTRATAPDARFAAVCMKLDEVSENDRLVGVRTPVAEGAEIVGPDARPGVDLPIAAGSEIQLTENGTHVRLLRLTQPLEIACSYPLVLHFEKAGAVRTTLNVDYARFL
jgi:hypothetical protein